MASEPESPFGFYANLSDDELDKSVKNDERPRRPPVNLFGSCGIVDNSSNSQLNLSVESIASQSSECGLLQKDLEAKPFKVRIERGTILILVILFIGVLAYIDFVNNNWLQRTVTSFLLRKAAETDL